MKAIILAAGMGTRLGQYGKDIPKGMIEIEGKSLIQRQIEIYRFCGINDISIVTGYQSERIDFAGIKKYYNAKYSETNMVESLMCARQELSKDVIISYADIIFEKDVLGKISEAPEDICVAVDMDWKKYWLARYGSFAVDCESMVLGDQGSIIELGTADPALDKMHARYVGLLKFSKLGADILKRVYDNAKANFSGKPWRNSKLFQKGYMTDLIQEIIDSGYSVKSVKINGGWLELDTAEDYERMLTWIKNGDIRRFCRIYD